MRVLHRVRVRPVRVLVHLLPRQVQRERVRRAAISRLALVALMLRAAGVVVSPTRHLPAMALRALHRSEHRRRVCVVALAERVAAPVHDTGEPVNLIPVLALPRAERPHARPPMPVERARWHVTAAREPAPYACPHAEDCAPGG